MLRWMARLCDGAFNQCAGKLLVEVAGLADAGFELVAERHQFVDFGDDVVLFS